MRDCQLGKGLDKQFEIILPGRIFDNDASIAKNTGLIFYFDIDGTLRIVGDNICSGKSGSVRRMGAFDLFFPNGNIVDHTSHVYYQMDVET